MLICFAYHLSNLYIKVPQGTRKFSLYEQLPFIYRLKLYALLINWKMRLLFIDSDLLHRGVLYKLICYIEAVICYIEVPFIDSDLLHRGALCRQ